MTETNKQAIARILLSALLVLTAILAIGSLYWRDYPLELLSSFRAYYFCLSLVIAIACIFGHLGKMHGKPHKRSRLLLYCSLALAVFNSVWIIPWYLPQTQLNSEDYIRVLTFNINTQNDRWDKIANSITTLQPDIATIIESSLESKQQLSQRLNKTLPFVYRTSGGGLTIFSRFPLISPESKTVKNGTMLVTSLQIAKQTVKLIAVHPIVPIKPDLFRRRNAFLAEITTYIQQQPKSLILLGDFNITPWSFYYKQLVNKTNLHNTRLGFGIEPSWLEDATYIHYPDWFVASMQIPIDHILIRGNIKAIDCQTAKAANSDHRMLWSDLVL